MYQTGGLTQDDQAAAALSSASTPSDTGSDSSAFAIIVSRARSCRRSSAYTDDCRAIRSRRSWANIRSTRRMVNVSSSSCRFRSSSCLFCTNSFHSPGPYALFSSSGSSGVDRLVMLDSDSDTELEDSLSACSPSLPTPTSRSCSCMTSLKASSKLEIMSYALPGPWSPNRLAVVGIPSGLGVEEPSRSTALPSSPFFSAKGRISTEPTRGKEPSARRLFAVTWLMILTGSASTTASTGSRIRSSLSFCSESSLLMATSSASSLVTCLSGSMSSVRPDSELFSDSSPWSSSSPSDAPFCDASELVSDSSPSSSSSPSDAPFCDASSSGKRRCRL